MHITRSRSAVQARARIGAQGAAEDVGGSRGRRKMLVFSNYDGSFVPICSLLNRCRVRHATLRGNAGCVERTLREFREGDLDVLLLNATNFGSGLNLEAATDVVLFHRMPDSLEAQVIGRAQRYGRSSALNAWHLMHSNELSGTGATNSNSSSNSN